MDDFTEMATQLAYSEMQDWKTQYRACDQEQQMRTAERYKHFLENHKERPPTGCKGR